MLSSAKSIFENCCGVPNDISTVLNSADITLVVIDSDSSDLDFSYKIIDNPTKGYVLISEDKEHYTCYRQETNTLLEVLLHRLSCNRKGHRET